MAKVPSFISESTRAKCLYHQKRENVNALVKVVAENFVMFRLNPLIAFSGFCEEIIDALVYKHGWIPIVRKYSGRRLSGAMAPDLTEPQKIIIRIGHRPVERCRLDLAIDFAMTIKEKDETEYDVRRRYFAPQEWRQKAIKEESVQLLAKHVFNMVCANPRRHAHLLPS